MGKLIFNDEQLDFDDVLIIPNKSQYKSRKDANLSLKYKMFKGIPLIASNMTSVGTIEAAKVLQQNEIMTFLHKFYNITELQCANLDKRYYAPSVGMNFEHVQNLCENLDIQYLHIDVANGYMDGFINFVDEVKNKYPNLIIIAGNVCTYEGYINLKSAGADLIKVGIGSGGNCTTRIKAGIGFPQFSAIQKIYERKNINEVDLISDGGCKTPADVVKAFVAGANFVCIGTMLAGHYENTKTENLITNHDGSRSSLVYGMSSNTASEKYYNNDKKYKTSEGKTSLIPFKGSIQNTIDDILGGIRSAFTYTNSNDFFDLNNAEYIKVRRTHNTHYDQYKIGE